MLPDISILVPKIVPIKDIFRIKINKKFAKKEGDLIK
jgi:hypothetical protein